MRWALPALLALSCGEPAVDGAYPGEPRFMVSVALGEQGGTDVRFVLHWLGSDESFDAPIVSGSATEVALAIYDEPPADAIERDGLRVAQIVALRDGQRVGAAETRVAFSTDGFALKRASLPCGADVTWYPALDVPARVDARIPDPAEPACSASIEALEDAPPPFSASVCELVTLVRALCRAGSAPTHICERCEVYVFPEGTDAAGCDAWHARCLAWALPSATCDLERRVCRDHEPRADACDWSCVCARYEQYCLDVIFDAALCAIKKDGCLSFQLPNP